MENSGGFGAVNEDGMFLCGVEIDNEKGTVFFDGFNLRIKKIR